ncbi:MAG: superfamily II DNA helicase RecQ, partial [Glaciecola sp.]
QELLQVFDWHIPVQEIVKLKAAVVAIKDNISPDCEPWIIEITENILACNKVAKDFQGNIFRITSSPDFVQKQTELQSRLKAAASYFLPKMELLKEELRLHNLAVKTKKVAISLDEPIEDVNQFLHDLLHRLKYFDKGDFNLGEYLENGKINKQKQQRFKSTYEASSTPKSLVSTSEIDHLKLYQAIALYRKGIASKSNEPIYKVFTNNAIKELCKHLPKTEDQLLLVNGFGPIKVKMFGDDVMKLICEYCEDNMVPAKDLFS